MNIHCLSVDDNEVNLMLIETLAEDMGMTVESFTNPVDALQSLKANQYDIIFVDYMMPEMDGITLIKNTRKFLSDIPIVMMTAVGDDNKIKLDALEAGATDFLPKPLNVPEFRARVTNLAKLSHSQKLLKDRALLLEEEVKLATKQILEREIDALKIIGRAADFKDNETGNHVKRVASYAKTIAEAIGFSSDEQDTIFYAS
ncbi:MAG: response regulator, partial [Calditerrivibrio sp.]|nr:response regulator [Calditerrivibrio sp.]